MQPRLPSLGGSPAKAIPLPYMQPSSPRHNVSPQGSPSTFFGSGTGPAQASPAGDQGQSLDNTDIRAGALPFEPPFQGDVYNGPIPLQTLALNEDGAFERLASSLETLSQKNSPQPNPNLSSPYQVTSLFALKKKTEKDIFDTSSPLGGGDSGGGSSGPSTALGDAAQNAVHVLKRLENRRVNLGQTYMVTVKEAYECLKETEHILQNYHSQVGTQISEQLNTFIKALDADFKTLQHFFEKQKQEQKKHEKELYQKIDQASTSAAALVMANSETKISELVGKVDFSLTRLERTLDSKIEEVSLSAAENQTSIVKTTFDGFQTVLKSLSDNIQILATQGSTTAAVVTLQNRLAELQNQQQTLEEQVTEIWSQKHNTLEEQLKAQAEQILELEKSTKHPVSMQPFFQNLETEVVQSNTHPALKLAVAGNCFLPHLHYHRHRVGVDWEFSFGLHKGTNSFENILQNRWFVGFKIEPFVSLALQTLSSRSGIPDGRGLHFSRKLQIHNFQYIREIGETENQPYNRVEIGWIFSPLTKNANLGIPVNLGGYWLEESSSSPNDFGKFASSSFVGSVKSLAPSLASDFFGALKAIPTFWRFFFKTDWYVSSGALFETKFWQNSVHFPITTQINGTLQLKVPGNNDGGAPPKSFQTDWDADPKKYRQVLSTIETDNSQERWMTVFNDRLMKLEPKVDIATKKIQLIESQIPILTQKSDSIHTLMVEQKGLQAKFEAKLENQEALIADHEKRLVIQKAEQEKCCQKVFQKSTDLDPKSPGENDFFKNTFTENSLDWLSKTLLWSVALEGLLGFLQGFGLGLFYLFLLRQQLRTTNLLEKNLYRTARFLIPAGYFTALFISLGMITTNFLFGFPLDTKWPILEKGADFSENLLKKIPGQDTGVFQKLNKGFFYGLSYGLPFVSLAKLFYSQVWGTHLGSPYTSVLICLRLSVSFVLFSKMTSWWTTWLISDSDPDFKNQPNMFPRLSQTESETSISKIFWSDFSFSLEIFATDPLTIPSRF